MLTLSLIGLATAATPSLQTDDAERFFDALEIHESGVPLKRALRNYYFKPGSQALHDYRKWAPVKLGTLAWHLEKRPEFYAALKGQLYQMIELKPAIDIVYRDFDRLVPDAVLLDTTLLVGHFRSAGTTSDAGVLLGAEMHGFGPDIDRDSMGNWLARVGKAPQDLPAIVAHELVHLQQPQRANYNRLRLCLDEGVADFIGELVSGKQINESFYSYGYEHEQALWDEFRPTLDNRNSGVWLYDASPPDGRPGDLGYFIGYRIAQSYYEQAGDKNAAIAFLLKEEDAQIILRESGYIGTSE